MVSQAIHFVLTSVDPQHFWLATAPRLPSPAVSYKFLLDNSWYVQLSDGTGISTTIQHIRFRDGRIESTGIPNIYDNPIVFCTLPVETVQSQVIYHRIMKRAIIDQLFDGCKDMGEYVGTFL